ncbi:MAG: hypothetical protein AB7V39_23170 [Nitrospiraceae bacterium]
MQHADGAGPRTWTLPVRTPGVAVEIGKEFAQLAHLSYQFFG